MTAPKGVVELFSKSVQSRRGCENPDRDRQTTIGVVGTAEALEALAGFDARR